MEIKVLVRKLFGAVLNRNSMELHGAFESKSWFGNKFQSGVVFF